MTPSAVTPSAAAASSRPFIPVTDDPGAASIIAETMTKTKEVMLSMHSLSSSSVFIDHLCCFSTSSYSIYDCIFEVY